MLDHLYNLFVREADGGGGGDTKPPAPAPAPEAPAPEPDKSGKQGGDEKPEGITLSKDAFNERLGRAKSSGEKTVLEALGFDSLEAAKQSVAKGTEAIKAQMTDQEKRDAELVEAKRIADTEKAAREQSEQRALQAETKAAALGLMGQFANPVQAYRLLNLSGVKRQDDGTFKGLKEAVEQLAKDEPWTLAAAKGGKKAPPIGATDPDDKDSKTRSESEDAKRARYFGGGVGQSPFFEGGRVVGVKDQE